jgi:hypothetical protein
MEAYCAKYNWDLIVLEELLDPLGERRFIICQKLLITSQPWSKDYDVIVWIDSDMWITENCPEIEVPDGKIGICTEELVHRPELQLLLHKRRGWQLDPAEYYARYGFTEGAPNWLMNAGLMVFQPKHHTEYLLDVYNKMIERVKSIPERDSQGTYNHYDQPYLGWRFHQDQIYHVLNWRYDVIWSCWRGLFHEPYDNPNQLVAPMRNLMDIAYTVHYTDREDVNVLNFVKKILPLAHKTLVVEEAEIPMMFSAIVRACNFKTIFVKTADMNRVAMVCPLNQYGWRLPKNIVPDLEAKGDVTLKQLQDLLTA